MRKSFLAMAVLSSLSSYQVFAAEEAPKAEAKPSYEVSYNVGLFSQYIFRGLTQTDGNPALQAGVDFTHESGFYLGGWGSNISWLEDSGAYKSGGSLELDLYGGYRTEIAKTGIGVDVGALTYYYPGTRDKTTLAAKANTTELYAALSWGWLQGKYSWVVSNSAWAIGKAADGTGDKADGTSYMEANLTVPVSDYIGGEYFKGTTLIAHIGRQNFKGQANQVFDYTDYKLGAQKSFDNGLNVGAYWTSTTSRDAGWTIAGKNIGDNTGTVFVQKTF